MATEFETKVLDINPEEIEDKLLKLGAQKTPEKLMRRWVFNINPKTHEWIRLRGDGKKITLCYKKREDRKIDGTNEIEIEINDFDAAAKILKQLKFFGIYYQENKRTSFRLNKIEFCLDSWPQIPTHLEIESTNEAGVKEGLKLLGLEDKEVGNISVVLVYKKHGIDLHDHSELKFS